MAGETAGLDVKVIEGPVIALGVTGRGANVHIGRTLAEASFVDYDGLKFREPGVMGLGFGSRLEVAHHEPPHPGLPVYHPEESITPRGQADFKERQATFVQPEGGDVKIRLGASTRVLGTLTINAPEGTATIGNAGDDLQRMGPLEVKDLTATADEVDLKGLIHAGSMTLNGVVTNVGPRVTADTVVHNGVQIHPPQGEGPSRVDVATLFPQPTAR